MKILKILRDQLAEIKKSIDSIEFLLDKEDFKSAYAIGKSTIKSFLSVLLRLKDNSKYIEKEDWPLDQEKPVIHAESFADRTERIEKKLVSIARSIKEGFLNALAYSLALAKFAGKGARRYGYAFLGVLIFAGVFYGGCFLYSSITLRHNGLKGEYFKDRKLKKKAFERVDKKIDFQWCRKKPHKKIGTNNFSIRWTGFLKIDKEDDYEIITVSDDGIRLWINGDRIIDDWNVHDPKQNSATIRLSPGIHQIKVEYFEKKFSAMVKLYWRKKGEEDRRIIHPKYLFPNLESVQLAQ